MDTATLAYPPATVRVPLSQLRVTGTPLEQALDRVVRGTGAGTTRPAFSSSI